MSLFSQGEWKDGCNGGCLNNPESYMKNPKFVLDVSQPANITIVITQATKTHVGFNVFRDEKVTDYVDTSPFSNATSISKALSLSPGRYFILATTFNPGINQPFGIEVYADAKGVSLKAV